MCVHLEQQYKCLQLQQSGSRLPVSNSFSYSRMLSWKRAVVTEEDLMQSGIIMDFIELRDSDASETNIVDILNYLCTV